MKISPSTPIPARRASGQSRQWNRRVSLRAGALAAILLLSLAVGTAWAAGEQMRRAGLSAGGARLEQGGYVLQSAIGQPVAGVLGQENLALCVGLLCGEQVRQIYLPVVSK